jgi:hypothetical protein
MGRERDRILPNRKIKFQQEDSSARRRTYQVEFRDNLTEGNWQLCPEEITIDGTQGSLRTTASNSQRYFRVFAF